MFNLSGGKKAKSQPGGRDVGQSSGLFIYLMPEALSDNNAVKMCFLLFYFTLEKFLDKAVAMTMKKKRERDRPHVCSV